MPKIRTESKRKPAIRLGRPKKLTERDVRCIVRDCFENPTKTCQELAITFNMIGDKKSISSSTVQKVLFKKGLRSYVARKKPYLSYAMKKKRFA